MKVSPRYLKFSTKVRGPTFILSDSGPTLRLQENITATDLSSDITKPHTNLKWSLGMTGWCEVARACADHRSKLRSRQQ